MISFETVLDNELKTKDCASSLAKAISDKALLNDNAAKSAPLRFYFFGEIGAGKSCFIRALLQTLGVKQKIKSPTFSIIETYSANSQNYVHMDLYRLMDEEELDYLGLDEYELDASIILIEWPEKVSCLPISDLNIKLDSIEFGQKRKISIQSNSKAGKIILHGLKNDF